MNPFATTAPRPLQPQEESLIKILAILNSTIEDGKIKIFAPDGVSVDWGNILGMIESQTDLTDYVQEQIATALTSVVQTQGGIDCSGNPDYPASDANFLWYVTVAGKIGGAAGKAVSIGDTIICITTNPGGSEALAGQYFLILNTNIPGLTTLGVAFATMVNPAVDSLPKIKPDGTVELVAFDSKQDTLPAGTALQVLRRNAANTGLEFATPSSGGGGLLWSPLDTPPVAPFACDDEFTDAATLPGGASPKWVNGPFVGVLPTPTVANSWMNIGGVVASEAYLLSTTDLPAGSYKFRAKLMMVKRITGSVGASMARLGLVLFDPISGKSTFVGATWQSTSTAWAVVNLDPVGGGGTNLFTSATSIGNGQLGGHDLPLYVDIEYNSVADNYTFSFATTLGMWFQVAVAATISPQIHMGRSPTKIGFYQNSNPIQLVDWFRRIS